MDAVINLPGKRHQAVGCNTSKWNSLKTGFTQLWNISSFSASKHHKGNTTLFLTFHEFFPVGSVQIFFSKLFVTSVIIAAFAAKITAVGHVIGGFAQKEVFAYFFKSLFNGRICDNVREFRLFNFVLVSHSCSLSLTRFL